MNFRELKGNKKLVIVIYVALLITVFASSYMVSYVYNTLEVRKTNTSANEESSEKEVSKLNDTSNVVLTRITLNDKVSIDYTGNIADLKKSIGNKEMTSDELEKHLQKSGYKLTSNNNNELVFEKVEGKLEPNKYYIGSKNGYIAIYKSDENGIVKVEKDEDVTTKKVDDLPERDRQTINNFERKFENKEDCEEELTNFIS